VLCGFLGVLALGCGESAGNTATAEARVRAELGIPPDAPRVLILSQSSHLDWDWLRTFDEYYQRSVDGIFTDALDLLRQYHAAPHHYFYSIAEMGFLQRFVTAHPELLQPLKDAGQDLRIVGGGITSPDNLLPPGEAFIRDYLVGKTWVDATLGLPIRQAWLPDDFGHDAQLPIVLEAMGFQGVGFARVPGVDTALRFSGHDPPPPQSMAAQLLQEGIDFVWQARDGSRTLAHWMPNSYCQGDGGVLGLNIQTIDDVRQVLAINGPASPTPYIFVPIGCDFAKPKPDLLELVDAWNEQEYAASGVWAVAASFDHYEQLVDAHRDALRTRAFDPTPYWTGYYASRPLLKSVHLQATQALLGAEVFGTIADAAARGDAAAWRQRVQARTAAIGVGWATLVPGNHHDFITGTALDRIYKDEQLPRLQDALAQGQAARTGAMTEIAAAVEPQRPAERTVVVFNQLGFARSGLVEVAGETEGLAPETTRQASAEGGTLFVAQVPSLGYATGDTAGRVLPDDQRVTVTVSGDGATVYLENDAVRATIDRDAGWGLTSVFDKHEGAETVAPGAVANLFAVYEDQGGLYRFGDEMAGCSLTEESNETESAGELMVLESGPLRVRVLAQVTLAGQIFQKEYQLVAGEPFVRMRSTGAAPIGTSVLVHFPLAGPIDAITYGTPYHWDRKAPARAGPLTFEAVHDFLVPSFNGTPRGAIFHTGVPAWATQPDGTVIGALWRNAPLERCDLYGAQGTDAATHTVDYAWRVAGGIGGPEQGRQLRESLAFQTSLQAVAGAPAGTLPREFSLASASPDTALITAAKAGTADPETLILRIYQPTETALRVTVHTGVQRRFPVGWRLDVHGRTALEAALPGASEARLALSGSPEQFTVTATRALTTVAVGKRP
jgi:alpha-mannosidase